MCSLFIKYKHGIWNKYAVAWSLLYTVETIGREPVGRYLQNRTSYNVPVKSLFS